MKRAKSTQPQPAAANLQQQLQRGFAKYNAERHLRAYVLDRDPKHVEKACDEYRKFFPGHPLPRPLLAWLDHATATLFESRTSKTGPKGRRNLASDIELVKLVKLFRSQLAEPGRPAMTVKQALEHLAKDRGLTLSAARKRYAEVLKLQK